MKPIKIFLAEDHHLVRQGFVQLLNDYPNIQIVGEAADGISALAGIKQSLPTLVLIDISMPNLSGIEVIKQINESELETKFLVISMHDGDEFLYLSYKAGAAGHIGKECSKKELFAAIFEILHGGAYFGNKTLAEMEEMVAEIEKKSNGNEIDYDKIIITTREKIIVQKLIQGKSTKEISDELFISENTVTTHRRNILHKFHCNSSFELVSLFNTNFTLNQRLNQI